MKPYQEEYLELLRSVSKIAGSSVDAQDPDAFIAASREESRARAEAVRRGSQLLREELFPVLDAILSVSDEEADSLFEFAGKLMSGVSQKDVGLHYRIHLALVSRARRLGRRDMLIRELYLLGMSLYNLETMLSPNMLRLYTSRMRMCFAESASYFDTEYDDIKDPETRGYVHRSMGNIALSYDGSDISSAEEKLAVLKRSISILSDPDVRAKTPSLPWDLYLYKSHQERTTLLNFLRSGRADADAFAQVLESAQIVQDRQLRDMKERGDPLQPRWQYAYMAARYHCGAMLLPELLEGLYSLSGSRNDDDFGSQSMFSHVSAPALYMEYSKHLDGDRFDDKTPVRIDKMTHRMLAWIVRAPSDENNEALMFCLRQFVYAYREFPGGMPFFELIENVFAARHPTVYVRMWLTGKIAEQLTLWAVDNCPGKLVGLPGCESPENVIWHRDSLSDFAMHAGRLHDIGMIHFCNLDASACRDLFEEEDALIRQHAHCGAQLLGVHRSTKIYSDIARGHHRRYDENGGYPADFTPESSPVKAMIYIVAAADVLASSSEETSSRFSPVVPFDEACARIEKGRGKRYAPFVSDLLGDAERREELRGKLEIWKREAYLDMYSRRAEMMSEQF